MVMLDVPALVFFQMLDARLEVFDLSLQSQDHRLRLLGRQDNIGHGYAGGLAWT